MKSCILALLMPLVGAGCAASDSGQGSEAALSEGRMAEAGESDEGVSWPVRSFIRAGPGEPIGSIRFTDPAGGSPRRPSVGAHGIRIVIEKPPGIPVSGETVRVVYSRWGAAETRSISAVESPEEPGLYLGTVDLVAAGEWRFWVMVVDGPRGLASVEVPEG